jgi:predicted MFS family arabinose efflux permease
MEMVQIASKRPLYWLALGAFAIVMEGFMIAPLLPSISTDLSVSVATAGLLVTVFAFAYAISSPVLTTLTGDLNRRTLLIVSLATFAAANVVAWSSIGYFQLMGARILLAFAAGLYLPNANAVAVALVAPDQRGEALAIVNGGASVAIALGVPLGAVIGSVGGWRTTFASVAVVGAIAVIGLQFGLPKGFGKGLPTATLRQRLGVARNPTALAALSCTTLWAIGAYTVYTYIAAYIGAVLPPSVPLSVVLFIWGCSAVAGMVLGGRFADKMGPRKVIAIALTVATAAFVGLSAISAYVPPSYATIPVTITVILWGASIWGFIAPQQARLVGIVGVNVAPIVLSLNASFMYMGLSVGAALGGFTLSRGTVGDLGWVGGLLEFAALGILVVAERRNVTKTSLAPAKRR